MGSTTANRSYPYPLFSDTVAPQDDIQNLAEAVDTDMALYAGRVDTPPMCVCKLSGTPTVSITTGGIFVAWDTDVLDTLGWHDPASNPTRITPTINGWYQVVSNIQFASQSGGRRWTSARLNGNSSTVYFGTVNNASTGGLGAQLVTEFPMNGTTDYFEVTAGQDSGSTVGIGDYGSTRVSCRLLYRL